MLALQIVGWIIAYLCVGCVIQGVVRRIDEDTEMIFGFMLLIFWPLTVAAILGWALFRIVARPAVIIINAAATANVPTVHEVKERFAKKQKHEAPLPIPHQGQRQ
jgi:hypothetical protein